VSQATQGGPRGKFHLLVQNESKCLQAAVRRAQAQNKRSHDNGAAARPIDNWTIASSESIGFDVLQMPRAHRVPRLHGGVLRAGRRAVGDAVLQGRPSGAAGQLAHAGTPLQEPRQERPPGAQRRTW